MKKTNKLTAFLFLFFALIATSCLKDNDTNPNVPIATMRMVNAYTGAESIYFTDANNYLTDPYRPIRYNTYLLDVIYLYPGNRQIKVYNSKRELLVETTVELKDSTNYTSFVYGKEGEAKNLITQDKRVEDLGDKSGIRFLHLANDIENVNVYFNSMEEPAFMDVAPPLANYTNELHDFTAQKAGKHTIIVTDLENNKLLEREVTFNKSSYYSIILTGDKESEETPLYIGVIQQ